MAWDNITPRYAIDIGGTELDEGITPFIESVEYESADGMADQAKVTIQNPNLDLQDLKIWQPGNEMSVWMGYGEGQVLQHIGRVIIRKTDWSYPESDTPGIVVTGFTYDTKLMDNEPEEGKKRRFEDGTFADIVQQVVDRYDGLEADIDPTDDEPRKRVQPAGVSDYRVIKSAANLTGYFFWIDGDENGVWTLHFKSPANVLDAVNQPEHTLRYNDHDLVSLLSFNPQLLVQGTKTKLKVQFKHPKRGVVVTEEIEDTEASGDVEATDTTSNNEDELKTAQSIKIFFQDFSFEIETKKKFKTAAEAKAWAAQWFRRQKESFILGDGKTPGIEDLRARQFHTLEGLGTTLDGKWYFSKVRHTMTAGAGYECTFHARKQDSLE